MDDDAPHPFTPDQLDISGLPATTEDLRQVLGRHRRHQARVLGAGLVGVLLAGAIAGFAVGRDGAHTTTLGAPASTPTDAAAAVAPLPSASGSSVSGVSPVDTPAVQLLVRNAADGTRVRLYQRSMQPKFQCMPANTACPPPPAGCVPTSLLSAEVSDDQVAGAAMVPQWNAASTDALQTLSAQVVGGGEPQPILVVIAHVTPAVTKVAMTTTYGTDTEVPTAAGWVALAQQLPATWTAAPNADVPDGTVTAATATGASAGSTSLPSVQGKNPPPACQPPPCTAPADKTTTSSASGATSTAAAPPSPPPAPSNASGSTGATGKSNAVGSPNTGGPKAECGQVAGGAGSGSAEGGAVSASGGVVAPARPANP